MSTSTLSTLPAAPADLDHFAAVIGRLALAGVPAKMLGDLAAIGADAYLREYGESDTSDRCAAERAKCEARGGRYTCAGYEPSDGDPFNMWETGRCCSACLETYLARQDALICATLRGETPTCGHADPVRDLLVGRRGANPRPLESLCGECLDFLIASRRAEVEL